ITEKLSDWCEPLAVPPPIIGGLGGPNRSGGEGAVPPLALTGRGAGGEGDRSLLSLKSLSSFSSDPSDSQPSTINHQLSTDSQSPPAQPDTFVWQGQAYRPNNLFRARVLGEFPNADHDTLIPLHWIEAAVGRALSQTGFRRAAADIARFGD